MTSATRTLARASKFLGSAHLRKVARHGRRLGAEDASELQALGLMSSGETIADGLNRLHVTLQKDYRVETVYKNAIARKLLVGRHGLRSATLLQELRVNNSIVDMVLLNGVCEAFEIKTEFDSPDKLHKQLDDYYRAFTRVTVVCDELKASQYFDHLGDSPAGLMVYTRKGTLRPVRAPQAHTAGLNVETMMAVLRQAEYMDVVDSVLGPQAEQPNTLRYRHYLRLAETIAPSHYAELMEQRLKARRPRETDALGNPKVEPIISSFLRVNPTQSQYQNIVDWLNEGGHNDVLSVPSRQAVRTARHQRTGARDQGLWGGTSDH
ncbi:sce7726 family protein [Pseudarthrobacter sp. 1G09]|uniref:sce7726 family protein n=1 Tax=Pseudarthrobacter sp. 1G09 TaxID=3416178 RepID=UPI003CED3635